MHAFSRSRPSAIIEQAGQENAVALKRTDLATALAEANAARENSARKLAELKKRQSELQVASMTNWSDKLAMVRNAAAELDFPEVQVKTQPVVEIPVENSPLKKAVNLRVGQTQ